MAYPHSVKALIPHRDRMKLVDEILDITSEKAVTRTVVSEKWPLFRKGAVNPLILIEIVAQTAAIHAGWKKIGAIRGDDGHGLLAGIKNAEFLVGFIPVHTVLATTIKPLYRVDNYTVLDGTVQAEDSVLCRVEIQVLEFDNDQASSHKL
ncbi:MAG: hypothetical protein ACOC8I_02090 [Desulfosalsimonas sp.]